MNVKPKKHLGQHFLNDEEIAHNIVKAIRSNNKNVLEIGPGMGVLTKYLLQQEELNFSVVEIDQESVIYLKKKFPKLNIISGDFLQLPLDSNHIVHFVKLMDLEIYYHISKCHHKNFLHIPKYKTNQHVFVFAYCHQNQRLSSILRLFRLCILYVSKCQKSKTEYKYH